MLGAPATEIDDRIPPQPGVDTVIVKKRPSAFAGTHLGGVLRAGGIDTLNSAPASPWPAASGTRWKTPSARASAPYVVRECVGDRVPAAVE